MDFVARSYERHAEEMRRDSGLVHPVIVRPDSIEAWRQFRLYEPLRPLLAFWPQAHWLTIGDVGNDAFCLKRLGAAEVTATCLADDMLRAQAERGHLPGVAIRPLNAEAMDLPDGSLDLVLCKETYHHLPRAPLGLYEMLRVARRAVVLIEPAEPRGWRPLDKLRALVKRVLRGTAGWENEFEPVGNFIFRLSEREVFKAATALQLGHVAFAHTNDFSWSPLNPRPRSDRLAFGLARLGIACQGLLSALHLMNWGLVYAVVFKEPLEPGQVEALTRAGFRVVALPRNPYLERRQG
ncbi:Methyltransferase domain-containing protein [Tistlia consotensis]|uniref:Methyltransferase domain-containing protein n=1 Tax=Tistlia consotensis USBA 355 TaxID=560819 RepID=A0A1Y6BR40_9PROT|nr:methyltransferase domain-containing protein [Tistlia consotensis]SMF21166.1 Methyltransferase domain-containing protein [Tistlia consotensis USBA 355]SNR47159.1 Methyltransferase domain-containing protein [Tistlia consotensis]